MAYDGFHPRLVHPALLHLTPRRARQPFAPYTLHPCACAWACARPTPVQAKVDTLHFPFCYSTVPARYDRYPLSQS